MELCHDCLVRSRPIQSFRLPLQSSQKRRTLQSALGFTSGQACDSSRSTPLLQPSKSRAHCSTHGTLTPLEGLRQSATAGLAICAACWLAVAQPALADLQTVSPSTATNIAKPLKTQSFDKNKIWLLFGAGAAGVLGTAILLERNERFFPAIAKANQAMRAAQQLRERQAGDEPRDQDAIDTSVSESDAASQSAFAAGLKEASQNSKVQAATPDKSHSPTEPEAHPSKPLLDKSQSAQQSSEGYEAHANAEQLQPK